MAEAALKLDERYTWADYCGWPEGERWEIIGGEAFAMSPSPTIWHQSVVVELGRQLANAFLDKPCRVFVSPADVKLSEQDVVEPDVFVVCEPEKIKRTHIEGAPTLVVEVLSPSSVDRDRGAKMDLYAVSGVKEVWIVAPYSSSLELFALEAGAYRLAGVFGEDDRAASVVFPELSVDLKRVFEFPAGPEEKMTRIKEDRAEYAAESAEPEKECKGTKE